MLRTKWKSLNSILVSEHVFAIGDIHSQAAPLRDALETIACIPLSGLKRHLIILGDTLSIGPASLATAELVQNAIDVANVDKVTVLLGNHEILLSLALNHPDPHLDYWSDCGGQTVLDEFTEEIDANDPYETARTLARRLSDYLTSDVERRPRYCKVDDLLFVHAGINPHIPTETFLSLGPDEALPGNNHWA